MHAQNPGGVLLLGSSGSAGHTRTAMAAATLAGTTHGIRPFVAADQEGGQIQRLNGSGFDRIPAARRAEAFRMNDNGWTGQIKQLAKYVE